MLHDHADENGENYATGLAVTHGFIESLLYITRYLSSGFSGIAETGVRTHHACSGEATQQKAKEKC